MHIMREHCVERILNRVVRRTGVPSPRNEVGNLFFQHHRSGFGKHPHQITFRKHTHNRIPFGLANVLYD